MADQERIRLIMGKLHAKATLSADELSEQQTHFDQLETVGRAAASHHDTHSTPGSHYSQHHSTVTDVAGILERISLRK